MNKDKKLTGQPKGPPAPENRQGSKYGTNSNSGELETGNTESKLLKLGEVEYIATILKELKNMADKSGHYRLTYFIEMAESEAFESLNLDLTQDTTTT